MCVYVIACGYLYIRWIVHLVLFCLSFHWVGSVHKYRTMYICLKCYACVSPLTRFLFFFFFFFSSFYVFYVLFLLFSSSSFAEAPFLFRFIRNDYECAKPHNDDGTEHTQTLVLFEKVLEGKERKWMTQRTRAQIIFEECAEMLDEERINNEINNENKTKIRSTSETYANSMLRPLWS